MPLREQAGNLAHLIAFLLSKHLRGADQVKLPHDLPYPCTPFSDY
jgi:hypothetical protein